MLKKKIFALFVVICMFVAQETVLAADLEIDDTDNTRDTQVEAKVNGGVSPSYVVTIPAKVDFGMLARPDTDRESLKTQDFNVKITKLENLGARQVLAILAQGSANDGAFALTNAKGKVLSYSFLEGTQKQDITGRAKYANGWYVVTSKVPTPADAPISCQLSLDQNQLNKGTLGDWEGTFSGSIRFYTAIADVDDYMPASQ